MKRNGIIIALVFIITLVISALAYSDSKPDRPDKIEKYAIMQQATSNSYEYKIDLGTSPEYVAKSAEINKSLSRIQDPVDALDYVLKQGFELYSCLYKPDGTKIVYILKEKK